MGVLTCHCECCGNYEDIDCESYLEGELAKKGIVLGPPNTTVAMCTVCVENFTKEPEIFPAVMEKHGFDKDP